MLAAAGLLLSAAPPSGAPYTCPLSGTEDARFLRAVTGDSFLTREGREIRLASVLAPGSDGETPGEDILAASRDALTRAVGEGTLRIAPVGEGTDRYGRIIADVFVGDVWLQARLVGEGVLRVAPDIASAPCSVVLLRVESDARAANDGHWGDAYFRVLSLGDIMAGEDRLAGSFQIMEATILDVTSYRGRYFLNFGDDYRTDFTVTIAPDDMRHFRAGGIDPDIWAGRRVRVRGWMETYNGPNLPIAAPEAIEVLQ